MTTLEALHKLTKKIRKDVESVEKSNSEIKEDIERIEKAHQMIKLNKQNSKQEYLQSRSSSQDWNEPKMRTISYYLLETPDSEEIDDNFYEWVQGMLNKVEVDIPEACITGNVVHFLAYCPTYANLRSSTRARYPAI